LDVSVFPCAGRGLRVHYVYQSELHIHDPQRTFYNCFAFVFMLCKDFSIGRLERKILTSMNLALTREGKKTCIV